MSPRDDREGSCLNTPQYDARDVLDRYIATLKKPNDGIIRDASELADPKDIIKFVLQHCIRTIDETDQQRFLREAYLSLGNFQELSGEERNAVTLLSQIGPPDPPGTDLHQEQVKQIGDVAAPLQAVMNRLKAEVAVLAQELKSLPGAD
jgi:hypothetical protein